MTRGPINERQAERQRQIALIAGLTPAERSVWLSDLKREADSLTTERTRLEDRLEEIEGALAHMWPLIDRLEAS